MELNNIDTLQNHEMNQKNRNKVKYETEVKVRCVNFMIDMIKKYGSVIETKDDSVCAGE